jgi:hypothetical protein
MNTIFCPDQFTAKQLAKHLHVSLASAYELIKVMRQAGMLDTIADSEDRRVFWHSMRLQRPLQSKQRSKYANPKDEVQDFQTTGNVIRFRDDDSEALR